MTAPASAVVCCEGFYDRSFWKGWLTHLGCHSLATTGPLMDPWGKPVSRGHFGFYSRSRTTFIRVIPCQGDTAVLREARRLLAGLGTEPIARLVINVDHDDTDATAPCRLDEIESVVQRAGHLSTRHPDGDYLVGDGALVSAVIWSDSGDAGGPGVPERHALERIVCAALSRVHPERGAAVATWLASRPAGSPPADLKAHAWSYMAGWYADRGCADFYEALWRDAQVIDALREKLVAIGAWRVAEALAV